MDDTIERRSIYGGQISSHLACRERETRSLLVLPLWIVDPLTAEPSRLSCIAPVPALAAAPHPALSVSPCRDPECSAISCDESDRDVPSDSSLSESMADGYLRPASTKGHCLAGLWTDITQQAGGSLTGSDRNPLHS